jgi:hypothetical protein
MCPAGSIQKVPAPVVGRPFTTSFTIRTAVEEHGTRR